MSFLNIFVRVFSIRNKKVKSKNFGFPFKSVKKTVIIFTAIIISISFILFFYFQQQTEQSIKDNILEQQIQNQKDSTRSLAQHIQSDLNLIMAKLQGWPTPHIFKGKILNQTIPKVLCKIIIIK